MFARIGRLVRQAAILAGVSAVLLIVTAHYGSTLRLKYPALYRAARQGIISYTEVMQRAYGRREVPPLEYWQGLDNAQVVAARACW